jgi:hypothetical protein
MGGDHEISLHEPAPRSQQATEQCRRDAERRIGHDPKGPAGKPQVCRIREGDDDLFTLEPLA